MTAAPIITRTSHDAGEVVVVSVELKLEGVRIMRAWLGEAARIGAADVLWQGFLDEVTGHAPEL